MTDRRPYWDTEPDEPDEELVEELVGAHVADLERERRAQEAYWAELRAERDPELAVDEHTPELEAPAALYGLVRCETCGRLRLTFAELPMAPCEHGRGL